MSSQPYTPDEVHDDNGYPIGSAETGVYDFSELIADTAEKTEYGNRIVELILEAAFETLAEKVAEKGYVQVHRFGSFRIKTLAAESGKLPNGDEFSVGERVTIEFNPFKKFRETLEERTGLPAIP